MEEKVVLKVDRKSHRSNNKVNKILNKFPPMLMKVIYGTPKKIMKKICKIGLRIIRKPDAGDAPKVVIMHMNQGNPLPPYSISSDASSYEGRPSYQYHNRGMTIAPLSDQQIYDSIVRGHGERRYDVGSPFDYYNQENRAE